MRGPLAGAELFNAVMTAAGWACQCQGECGSTHRKGGICRIPDTDRARLLAAPERPLPDREAVTADADALRAWCPNCWHRITTAADHARQDAAAQAQDPLF
ncbi:hypothetical protein OG757_23535 [Streptomyces sp. NBC_01262]|nr:hypothetical protein [Streptomyces sp. NBC_01262]